MIGTDLTQRCGHPSPRGIPIAFSRRRPFKQGHPIGLGFARRLGQCCRQLLKQRMVRAHRHPLISGHEVSHDKGDHTHNRWHADFNSRRARPIPQISQHGLPWSSLRSLHWCSGASPTPIPLSEHLEEDSVSRRRSRSGIGRSMSKLEYLPPLILLACAAALYLGSREGFDAVIPEVPEESLPAILFRGHCMERSDQIYQNEIAIHRKTEKIVGYGRFRDDMHGKGLTRITTERLEREEQCKQS